MKRFFQFWDWLNCRLASYCKQQRLLAVCLGFFLLLNIASLLFPLKESLTIDETSKYESGLAILSGTPSERGRVSPEMNFDQRNMTINQRNIMPISALNPLVSQVIATVIPDFILPKSVKEDNEIFFGKLATILVSLVLAIYVFRWARQLYGVHAAFLALCLYILDPNIIAHSRLVTQDLFSACSLFVAVYYFWRCLKFNQRKDAVWSMITFGIAQISRYTAVYLVPIYCILALGFYHQTVIKLVAAQKWELIWSGIKQCCRYVILLFCTTVLIINLGFSFERTFTKLGDYQFESQAFKSLQSDYSFLKALPVPVPYAYLRGLDFGKYKQEAGFGSGASYLKGQLGLNNDKLQNFKAYYLITFIYKVPIATQLILFIAIVSLIRHKSKINFWQNEAFLIIPALFFGVICSLSTSQLGIRYILMLFPFLFVFSSRVVISWTTLKNRYRIFVISLSTYLLISNLTYFPHYISYFNELLLDKKLGYTILADSNLDWNQSRSYLKDYLDQNPEIMYAPSWSSVRIDPEYKLPTSNVFIPVQPQAGLVITEVNNLVGITAVPTTYQWIRENLQPLDHLAYSYLIFEIKPRDLAKVKIFAKVYQLGTALDFRASADSYLFDYQWGGWSLPEAEGTWTNGKEARLFLQLIEPVEQDLVLSMEALPFVHQKHPQQVVDVLVNQQLVQQFVFGLEQTEVERYNITLPAEIVNLASPVQITFRFADLVSPRSVGLGEDERKVGLRLTTMKLMHQKSLTTD